MVKTKTSDYIFFKFTDGPGINILVAMSMNSIVFYVYESVIIIGCLVYRFSLLDTASKCNDFRLPGSHGEDPWVCEW